MKHTTELMSRLYSDYTTDEFKQLVSDRIEEARQFGESELLDSENNLSFSRIDENDVVIEDKRFSEVTIATPLSDGNLKLDAYQDSVYSATQPDVDVPTAPDDVLPEGSTLDDVEDPDDLGIVDKNKAGKDKHYSMGVQFDFSDDELNSVYSALDDAQVTAERLAGTEDIQLAYSLQDQANILKAYSVLGSSIGLDLSDVYESAQNYSDYAESAVDNIVANTPVTEFFSNLSDYDTYRYFSELEEPEVAEALYSVLESGDDTITFSDISNMMNSPEFELETPIVNCFSSVDEMVDYFSDNFSDSDCNAIFSELNEVPDLTFSDVNDILEIRDTPLDQLFSDMSVDELSEFTSNYSEDESQLLFSMASDEDYNYTFSDFEDTLNYLYSDSDDEYDSLYSDDDEYDAYYSDDDEYDAYYSDDDEYDSLYSDDDEYDAYYSDDDEYDSLYSDTQILDNNLDQMQAGGAAMQQYQDPELAEKVKALAQQNAADAQTCYSLGCDFDIDTVLGTCQLYSDAADEIIETSDYMAAYSDIEDIEDNSYYSDDQYALMPSEDMRVFSDGSESSVNSCLTSTIN